MSQKTPVTVARGDDIAPEIIEASLRIMQACGAEIEIARKRLGRAEIRLRCLRVGAGREYRVACFTKDNTMNMTDGLLHAVFAEIGVEYPEFGKEHLVVDIGAAQIAGSANVGTHASMFEAIHGSAPRRAGQNVRYFRSRCEQTESRHEGICEGCRGERGKEAKDVCGGFLRESAVPPRGVNAEVATVSQAQIAGLYQKMSAAGYDIVKTESLRTFNGKAGFTLAQGQ